MNGKEEKVFDALEWPALLNFPKGTLFNRVNVHVLPCPKQGGAACREPLGLETCRRAHVESLGAERPLGRMSGPYIKYGARLY